MSNNIAKLDTPQDEAPRHDPLTATLRRLWSAPNARIGGVLVILMVSIALLVPLLDSGYDPRNANLRARYEEPDCVVGFIAALGRGAVFGAESDYEFTCEYPMGADKTGKDIMQRVGHGMSASLVVSIFVVVIALTTGTVIGLVAGFSGGIVDTVLMRGIDILLAFPALLLAIVLVTIFQPSLLNGMIAIAVTQIPIYARLARSMAISIRETEYVMAARSLGAGNRRLLVHYVLPNSLSPLIVQSTLLMGTAVIETAALGFLGLGQQPPHPELGKMLADSQQSLQSGKWWVMAFPGVAIVLIVLGFNLLGDGLRDALDPRLNRDR